MKKKTLLLFLLLLSLFTTVAFSQDVDVSAYYGRFWSPYKYKDYGSGFRNASKSNHNFFPSVVVNKYYKNRISAELGIHFTVYEQYYSTRLYWGAFNSTHIAGHIVLRGGYSLIRNTNFECRLKGGIGLGVSGLYQWEYTVVAFNPTIDSVTRGIEKKNFTPVFPMISTGADFSYKISKRFKISIAANYQKGFIKITEYDIYYNDGSGKNDQRARQWGTGDFYGVQLGLRYSLKSKEKKK